MFNSITKKIKSELASTKKNVEIEGFICPMCMASFVSPEMVQQHFIEKHPDDNDKNKDDTVELFSPTTQRKESIRDIQENLNDLRQSLDEEVWYNEELKKECTRLNGVVSERDKEMQDRDKVIENHKKQFIEIEAARDILNEELKKMQISNTSLMAENKTIRSDFRVCEDRMIELESSRKEMIKMIEELNDEKTNLTLEVVKLEENDAGALLLTEQLRKSQMDLECSERHVTDLCEQSEQLRVMHQVSTSELEMKYANLSKDIEALQLERSSLVDSNEKITSDNQQNLELSRAECDELRSQLELVTRELKDSEEGAAKVQRQCLADRSQIAELSAQLARSAEEFQQVKSQNKDMMQRIKGQEVEILQIRNLTSNKEEEIKTLQKSARSSSEQLDGLRQQLEVERRSKDELQSQIGMTDAANLVMEQMQLEKRNLQESIVTLERQLEEEIGRANNDLSQARMEMQSQKEEILKWSTLVSEKEEKVKETEKMSSEVHIEYEKYQQKASEEKLERSSLEEQLLSLKRNLETKEESLKASMESHLSQTREHELLLKSAEKERDSARTDLVNLKKEMVLVNLEASKVDSLEKEVAAANGNIRQLDNSVQHLTNERNDLAKIKETIEKSVDELNIKLAARDRLVKELEDASSAQRREMESQSQVIQSKTSLEVELQAKIVDGAAREKCLDDELTVVREYMVSLQHELDEMKQQVVRCEQSIEESGIQLSQASKEKVLLESEVISMKNELLEQHESVSLLNKEKERLESTSMENLKNCEKLKESLSSTRSEKENICMELAMVKMQVEETQRLYSESMVQQNIHENEVKTLVRNLEASNSKLSDLEEEYKNSQQGYSAETEKLRKEATQIRNHAKALEKTLNESSENYKQEILESTERELTLKSQCEDFESKIVTVTKSFQRTEEDLESEKTLRQTERNNMMEKISQLTGQVVEGERLRNDLDQRLESVETDNIENKIRLEAVLDEKEKLLEKIIQMENNTKRQNEAFTKKCREFDQLQSAILDLGRENQSLQITKEKITSRLWIVDDEAVECHNCHKMFSLTHRKHHCRNCGQVFCQDCSTKTATLAVSRKPVRVCDVCHLEVHSHRRNSSTQSSNISLSLQN